MFSGIVEELGGVRSISVRSGISRLQVQAGVAAEGTVAGDSVAVNGVCLTVTANKRGLLEFDVMPETLKTSNLGKLKPGEKVNLERALQSGKRISGHFVNGHVDTCAAIRTKGYRLGNMAFSIVLPEQFRRNIFLKGSIAIDGISLTVAEVKASVFSVFVIPYTAQHTTLGFKGPGQAVNLEFDMLAKAVLAAEAASRHTS